MSTLTPENSPEYLTVKECQTVCRFKGPEAIRRAVYRGDLPGIRVRANRLLIPSTAFWKWFHQNDINIAKPKSVQMPVGAIKKPRKEGQLA
jgi:hypothetical protein